MANQQNSRKNELYRLTFIIIFSLSTPIIYTRPAQGFGITTERIASGLDNPLYVTSSPGDTSRLFIVEQHTGRIKILNLIDRTINPAPFLDIDGLAGGNEQGLLGLAFDPDYLDNGLFYVNLNITDGTTEIRRYQVSPDDPNIADPVSESMVMTYSQPFSNHNGGWIGFGPDGYFYICAGDGGSGNDPGNRAQDITNQRLGKILRIDVHGDDFPADPLRNYAIAPTNPFVGITGDDEIWAFGLRNPWRASFDRLTGDFYIADVGQNQKEEINFQPAESTGGENYGWRVMEGFRCNISNDPLPCDDPSFVAPIHDYSHNGAPNAGQSVTGGYVYRGPVAELQGIYFFADYVSSQIWSFRYDGVTKTEFANRTEELRPDVGSISSISSFGEDTVGNLYIVDLGGEIFKIKCDSSFTADFDSDCDVDKDDFELLASAWLAHPNDERWDPRFDISEPPDGRIDSLDVAVLLDQWQQDPRLVAHWRLDETEGMVAHDSIGNQDAILEGGPEWRPLNGKIAGALEFDGIDDYARTPVVLNPALSSFSVFAGVKSNSPGRGIISHSSSSAAASDWLSTNQDGELLTGLTGSSRSSGILSSDFTVTDGQWHQVGLVWDQDTQIRTLYGDMTVVARDQVPQGNLMSADGNLFIGAVTSLSPDGFWLGLIDDVRIYDQVVNP
jgi:glucose/arabinose dehydrogenase